MGRLGGDVEVPVKARRSILRILLPVQMLIGLAVGCVIGLLWPRFARDLLPLGQTFVKACGCW